VPTAVSLAAAMLAHYSAGPYVAAIGLHCLYQVIRHRRPARPAILAAAAAAALLATWFVWSLAVYGTRITFLSNTTATSALEKSTNATVYKTFYDLLSCAIPHVLRPVAYKPFSPPRNWGDMRDYYFMMAQSCLPTMVGLVSGAVALWLIVRFFRSPPRPWPHSKPFWLYFLLFTYIVGVAVNPGLNYFGIAEITLQPLALMGVTLVAAQLPSLKPWLFRVLCAGLILDYAFGILLEFDRESYIYPTIVGPDKKIYMLPDATLGTTGATEYINKVWAGYVFIGDHLSRAIPAMEVASALAAAAAVLLLARMYQLARALPESAGPRSRIWT